LLARLVGLGPTRALPFGWDAPERTALSEDFLTVPFWFVVISVGLLPLIWKF